MGVSSHGTIQWRWFPRCFSDYISGKTRYIVLPNATPYNWECTRVIGTTWHRKLQQNGPLSGHTFEHVQHIPRWLFPKMWADVQLGLVPWSITAENRSKKKRIVSCWKLEAPKPWWMSHQFPAVTSEIHQNWVLVRDGLADDLGTPLAERKMAQINAMWWFINIGTPQVIRYQSFLLINQPVTGFPMAWESTIK